MQEICSILINTSIAAGRENGSHISTIVNVACTISKWESCFAYLYPSRWKFTDFQIRDIGWACRFRYLEKLTSSWNKYIFVYYTKYS